jgi:hypothetical protein
LTCNAGVGEVVVVVVVAEVVAVDVAEEAAASGLSFVDPHPPRQAATIRKGMEPRCHRGKRRNAEGALVTRSSKGAECACDWGIADGRSRCYVAHTK